ncbi:MAG: histidine phosphatase family protein [Candidatus Cybelea sp.]
MKLTLIRHGPTEWNATRRFQGRTDVPLSAHGRAAAQTIAERLREEPIDRIYSSDLSRALETARIVAQARRGEIVSDERLREFDFGRWEGLTWDEIVARYPHLPSVGFRAAKDYAPEGGEAFARVRERIASFLDDLAKQPIESVAVVTHAGPLHAFFSVLDLDKPGLRFTAGGITRIGIEHGTASLISLDEREHLEGVG